MINLIRAEDTGIWMLPSDYKLDDIVTVYLDGKAVFEDVDFKKIDDNTIDVFRTTKSSIVTAIAKN